MGHWERLTMVEAVKKYSGVDYYDWKSDEDARAAARKSIHVEVDEIATTGRYSSLNSSTRLWRIS